MIRIFYPFPRDVSGQECDEPGRRDDAQDAHDVDGRAGDVGDHGVGQAGAAAAAAAAAAGVGEVAVARPDHVGGRRTERKVGLSFNP